MTFDPYQELREAAGPAVRTMLSGADLWERLADTAEARGDTAEAERLRRQAGDRRARARKLLAFADELAAEYSAAYPTARG